MHVEPPKEEPDGTKSSTIVSLKTLESHEGSYTCTEGNETHHLAIIYGS